MPHPPGPVTGGWVNYPLPKRRVDDASMDLKQFQHVFLGVNVLNSNCLGSWFGRPLVVKIT